MLYSEPFVYLTVAAVLGLLVGSFLNVVIYRLPIMMEREWRAEAKAFLGEDCECKPEPAPKYPVFNLVKPDSTCTQCDRKIRPWENIPVLSYLFMFGRCACKQTPISLRYPFVELLTGVLSFLVAWRYGFTVQSAVGIGFVWVLVALAFIDADTMLLPDQLTLPLMWFAILASYLGIGFTDLRSSVLGAVFGYLCLWTVYWAFKLLTKKEGMGYGDFKLLAAIGALLGWQTLIAVVLLSAVTGSVIGLSMMALKNLGREVQIPFGPYLAAAGAVALLIGVAPLSKLLVP
jgi:leader peptidase (prepilin peptidase) / N-methyltransferase